MAGALVGVMRHVSALSRQVEDKHGGKGDMAWQYHLEGACGEMAFAKAVGWYYDSSVDTFKRPDVGPVYVRTRSRHSYELIVRKGDPSGVYVLVTGQAPGYVVRGWIHSDQAKDGAFLQEYGGREEAYFVPQKALRLIGELNASAIPSQS